MRLTWTRKKSLLLLLLLLLLAGVFWGWRSLKYLRSFQSHLDALQALASGDPALADLSQAVDHGRALREDMLALDRDAGPALWLLPHLGWVPKVGPDLRAGPDMLELGLKLSEAGDLLLQAFAPMLESGLDSPDLKRIASRILLEAEPQLEEARSLVEEAAQARARIDAQALSPRLQSYLDKLDRYVPLAQLALDAGQAAPALLGLHGPQSFLVVAQNNDELRATGGFITAAGRLMIYGADLIDMSFMDSYAVDDFSNVYPDPPQALYDTMLAEQWLFRDSNWSPDFPTSARQMAEFYTMGTGHPVDGVIALDMVAVELLVNAVGPLSIEGHPQPLTGANILDWMRSARGGLEQGQGLGEWWGQRKDFLGPLSAALKQRLDSGAVDWIALAKAGLQAVEGKHLLLYFSDPQAQSILQAQGWDGAVSAVEGDAWMLVDSNVGFNKADMSIERKARYVIRLQPDGSAHSTLALFYTNQAPRNAEPCDPAPRYSDTYLGEAQRCYWDYVRVILPQDLELLEAPHAPLPEISLPAQKLGLGGVETFSLTEGEGGRQVAAWTFLLPKAESYQAQIDYLLPPGAAQQVDGRWRYQLQIQKQPGSCINQVEVEVHLPQGAQVVNADPVAKGNDEMGWTFVFRLERDQRILLEYVLDA